MGNWSIIEALDRAAKEASKQFTSSSLPIQLNPKMDLVEQLALGVKPLLSLILYICSEKPEYSGGIPSRPQPKRTKKGWRIFPPLKPKIIDVGMSIGDSLRAISFGDDGDSSERSIRPHIRRGHWHGYWIGKKDGEDRKFIYNWLSPIPVNAKEIG